MSRTLAEEQVGPIFISTLGKGDDNTRYWRYRVAEMDVLADLGLSDLEPFAVVDGEGKRLARPGGSSPGEALPDLGFRCRARGPIGRGVSDVELEVGPETLDLAVDGAATYAISRDRIVAHGSELDSVKVEQTLSGICLILALALRRVFVLHASAVLYRDRAIAFAGDSGVGKSTLAAHAPLSPPAGAFRRLADDVLPFGSGRDGGARVWPAFPQLKLGGLDQPALGAQSEYPLQALLLLRPSGSGGQLAISRLARAEATAAILAHTVAARLFPPALLRQHLELAARLAESLPVFGLDYPHKEETPDQVYDLIGRLALRPV